MAVKGSPCNTKTLRCPKTSRDDTFTRMKTEGSEGRPVSKGGFPNPPPFLSRLLTRSPSVREWPLANGDRESSIATEGECPVLWRQYTCHPVTLVGRNFTNIHLSFVTQPFPPRPLKREVIFGTWLTTQLIYNNHIKKIQIQEGIYKPDDGVGERCETSVSKDFLNRCEGYRGRSGEEVRMTFFFLFFNITHLLKIVIHVS